MKHSGNQEERQAYQSPVRPVFDKFAKHKDVTLIYGEPISMVGSKVQSNPVSGWQARLITGKNDGRGIDRLQHSIFSKKLI